MKPQNNDNHKVKIDPENQQPETEARDDFAEDLDALQAEMNKLQEDAEAAHNSYLRTLADFDNYRKRQREETARMCDYAREGIISQILPIVDNFERTLQAADAQHSYDTLVEGVNMIVKQIRDMLEKEGVQPIEAAGQEFNPELHEALMRVPTDEYPENTVVDELEKGYTLNGRVLRPARVRVAVSD